MKVNKIENEWCVYGWVTAKFLGKVVREHSEKCVDILYTPGQVYPSEPWDTDYVKRFATFDEAFEYLREKNPDYGYKYMEDRLRNEWELMNR